MEIITKRVQRRRIELEGAQVEDEFEERARRKAAEEAENRRLLAEAKAQQEQQEWLQAKLAYALARLPQAAPLELKRAAYNAALKFLQDTDRRIVPDEMVNAFLNDSLQTVVRTYNQRQNEIKRQEQEARQRSQVEALHSLLETVAQQDREECQRIKGLSFFAKPAPTPQLAAPGPEPASVDAEAGRQARQRAAADKAEQLLKHINTHLKIYEFSGGWPEQRREADRLRLVIRQPLIDALLADPTMTNKDGRALVEREIDERIS
ncbi:MAG: hypothetical protein WB347_23510 [Terriglobales bacterium]